MKKRLVAFLLLFTFLLSMTAGAQALTNLAIYAEARFSRGYDCYSGPGTYYYRSNNGKATYGGGGVARVYGVTGDWIMIGYGFGNNQYRIGYIEKGALKGMSDVKGTINYNLTFTATTMWARNNCSLTDDPVINNTSILTIPQGTVLTALGTMGTEWTYVEVMGTSSLMRGFVRSSNLSGSYVAGQGTPSQPSIPSQPTQPTVPQNVPNSFYHSTTKGIYLPDWQSVRFSRSYPVYSGPGTYYYRANEGKATMGGGVCRLYGVEGSWALIGYELSNGTYRLGYVEAAGLPQAGLRIPYLDLQSTTKTVLESTYLTDDIVMYTPVLLNLSRGTTVTFLGLCPGVNRTWAFVEVMGTSSLMRGFIPASALGY